MGKKRHEALILGPDGMPLDKAAYRPKPEPAKVTMSVDGVDLSKDVTNFTVQFGHSFAETIYSQLLSGNPYAAKIVKKPRSLADAVGEDIAALTVDFEGETVPEMPVPKRDLDTYDGAFASAAENCLHENAIEMLYGREWTCDDCGRSIDRAEMLRARKKRSGGSIFGWFGL